VALQAGSAVEQTGFLNRDADVRVRTTLRAIATFEQIDDVLLQV
jgi:hypothetical protein